MKLSLKRIEGLEARGSVAVKVIERYRNDSFEYLTPSQAPSPGPFALNFTRDLHFPLFDLVTFTLLHESDPYGPISCGSVTVKRQSVKLDQEMTSEFETSALGKPTLFFEFSLNDSPGSDTEKFDGTHRATRYLTIRASGDGARLALISVTKGNRFASVSRFRFNGLGFCDFSENSVCVSTQTIGSQWATFIVFVEAKDEKVQIGVTFDFEESVRKTFNKGKSLSVVPLKFEIRGENVVIESVETPMACGFPSLYGNLGGILEELKVPVSMVPKMLEFDNACEFWGNSQRLKGVELQYLKVMLRHEAKESLDLALGILSTKRKIADTCFFNHPSVMRGFVTLVNEPTRAFDSYLSIDLQKPPESAAYLLITLTSFSETPLNKFGKVTLTFMNQDDVLLLELPLTLVDDCGFFVGALEKVEQHWKFVYFGVGMPLKVPPLVVKEAVTYVLPAEDVDDVVWEE